MLFPYYNLKTTHIYNYLLTAIVLLFIPTYPQGPFNKYLQEIAIIQKNNKN